MKKSRVPYESPEMCEMLLFEKSLICASVDGMSLPDAEYYEYGEL